jgi:hypothetical protein
VPTTSSHHKNSTGAYAACEARDVVLPLEAEKMAGRLKCMVGVGAAGIIASMVRSTYPINATLSHPPKTSFFLHCSLRSCASSPIFSFATRHTSAPSPAVASSQIPSQPHASISRLSIATHHVLLLHLRNGEYVWPLPRYKRAS